MIEEIPFHKLTKKYIDNHDVICNGVHCKHTDDISIMTGKRLKPYVVFKTFVNTRFATLRELKRYIVDHVKSCGMKLN